MKISLLRKLITEILKESLPIQNSALKDDDLLIIGEKLSNKLENAGYSVQKSKSSFSNMCIFEVDDDGRYLVSIRKKTNFHSVNEDSSSVQVFRRDNPELSAFLKKMSNKNVSKKTTVQQQHKQKNKSSNSFDNNDDTIYDLNIGNDATIFAGNKDNEVFKTIFEIEYTITFQDMLKTANSIIEIKNKFMSNSKDNIEKNKNFNIFADQLVSTTFNKFTSY